MLDVNSFLEQASGETSTKRVPIPAGTYRAYIQKVGFASGTVSKAGENYGKPWARADITWEIDDDELRAKLNRASILVTQGIMLELDPSGSKIATGEGVNIRYGKFRAAIGKNGASDRPADFVGCGAMIQIDHEMYEDQVQERVKSVAKVG
jgi:hypothetical protein